MAFQDDLNQYFFQPGDEGLDAPPLTFDNCHVTPLIDGANYNTAVLEAINQTGNEADNSEHFIFIANWWLGLMGGEVTHDGALGPQVDEYPAYEIDPNSGTLLMHMLNLKANDGVDVRVMAWVNDALMSTDFIRMAAVDTNMPDINALSMQSIAQLRDHTKLRNGSILNLLSHSGGGVHLKMVLVGNDDHFWAFTGGIDFVMNRFDNPTHVNSSGWHDAAVMVEGPAAQALYDHYRFMYNENLDRKAVKFKFEGYKMASYLPDTKKIKARSSPPLGPGTQHVQSLRTIPRFLYKSPNCFKEVPAPAAFPNGLFEFRCALKKAIDNADRYIYIEDQAFWSVEIMEWINARVKANPNLNVILLTSGAPDPNDPDFNDHFIYTDVFNNGLVSGLNAAQRNRIGVFQKWSTSFEPPRQETVRTVLDDQADSFQIEFERQCQHDYDVDDLDGQKLFIEFNGVSFPVIGNDAMSENDPINLYLEKTDPAASIPAAGDDIQFFRMAGITVHSKTVIIDDKWALIGSANQTRRSLYSDWEHAVAFMDESNDTVVREYRKALWNEHFVHNNPDDFSDLEDSLHSWNSGWGTDAGVAPDLPERPGLEGMDPPILDPMPMPYSPNTPWTPDKKNKHDVYSDFDSRVAWSGL